jgi:hypothetical protein
LEQVLGTGGSQFPVSIILKSKSAGSLDQSIDDSIADVDEDVEDQAIEAKMFVNNHIIKICFND